MKSVLNFFFAYGHLGWKGRLSWQDYLYHQGRLILPFFLFGVPFFAMLFLTIMALMMGGVPDMTSLKMMMTYPQFWIALTVFLGLFSMVAFLAVASVRLSILRLHDLNLSGWCMLAVVPLMFIDKLLAETFYSINDFLSVQSLAFLALYIWPGTPKENRFGVAEDTFAGRRTFVKVLPLLLFFALWVFGITEAFKQQAAVQNPQTDVQMETTEIQEHLRALQAQPLPQSETISPTLN